MGTRITKSRTFIREKKWRCSSCGVENPGRSTSCSNCGSPKENDERYESVGSGEVKDPGLLQVFQQGPNRTCPYCNADVRDNWETCPTCGARRYDHEGRVEGMGWEGPDKPKEELITKVEEAVKEWKHETPELVPIPAELPVRRRLPLLIGIPLGVIALAGLAWLFIWVFSPWETDATITGVRWSYHVDLRQRTPRRDADWRGSMHAGAYNVSCVTRQRGTENCNPHECNCRNEDYECNCTSHDCNCHESCSTHCSDNGNGSETCTESCSETCDTCRECDTCRREVCDTCYDQCPVYDEWCEYTWDDWPVVDQATTSGSDLNVYPPPLRSQGAHQRLETTTVYTVSFSTPDGARSYRASSIPDFQRFTPGRWRIKTNRAGMVWPLRRL